MTPLRVCRPVTKLIPQLVPTQTCMDVPREVCSKSKVNPRRVKRPVIRKVCIKKDEGAGGNNGNGGDASVRLRRSVRFYFFEIFLYVKYIIIDLYFIVLIYKKNKNYLKQ